MYFFLFQILFGGVPQYYELFYAIPTNLGMLLCTLDQMLATCSDEVIAPKGSIADVAQFL